MSESRLPLTSTDTGQAFDKSTLVLVTLGISSLNALLVVIAIPYPLLNQLAGIALVIYLLLAAMVWGLGAVSFAAHALVVCSFGVFATLASQTGGINSPAVVWMPILSIAALLLINLRWAMVWMGLIVVHNVLQFTAVQAQWIEGHVDATVIPESVAFWIRVNVLFFVMVALGLYEAMFRRTSKSLALRNLEMEGLQAARQEAQNHIDALILSLGQYLRAPIQKVARLQSHLQLHPSSTLTPTPPQIKAAAENVVELVNQVLEIAQYETDRLVLKQTPFNVREAVCEAALTPAVGFAPDAVSLTPQNQVEASLWVLGDGARFTQVLRHALHLAQRHAAGGQLQVLARMQTSVLLIQVLRVSHDAIKPTGDNSALPHDSVDQAGRPTSNAQDWEHALCERLLTLAGASLSNMQELGATSTIELRWPAPLCEAPQAPGFAPTAPESKPWRFLLVDDQPKRLLELQSMVRRHWPGAILGQSDSGESALLQLEFTPYDMVLIALHLQGMDGLETVRRMRQHAKAQLRDVPVIGLCDKAFAHQRQRYLAAGMQWLLFRPLQEAQLARLMRLHLPEEVL